MRRVLRSAGLAGLGLAGLGLAGLGLACLGLAGCGKPAPPPKPEAVAAAAKTALQAQVDQAYPNDHAVVQDVTVNAFQPPRYDGEATLSENGKTFKLRLAIKSDGKTTDVSFDQPVLAEGIRFTWKSRLGVLDYQYGDYILTKDMVDLLPASLRANLADFKARMAVATPIVTKGEWYVGHGCMAHDCANSSAEWALNKNTGASAAIIKDAHAFRIYGARRDKLPPPLAAWASGEGMTAANSVEVAPPKP
jgi:hypothetical protein